MALPHNFISKCHTELVEVLLFRKAYFTFNRLRLTENYLHKDSYFYAVKKIGILNGPNLNLLGKREPEIYGNKSFEDFLVELKARFENVQFEYNQSNVEGELINQLQAWNETQDALIINLGGYSHTSVALADAIKGLSIPVIEVHISNIYAREEFRHRSLSAAHCQGCIMGLGLNGYTLAVDHLIS